MLRQSILRLAVLAAVSAVHRPDALPADYARAALRAVRDLRP
ncbi:DUF6354 family protein [Streptomyces sp. NPDC089915]